MSQRRFEKSLDIISIRCSLIQLTDRIEIFQTNKFRILNTKQRLMRRLNYFCFALIMFSFFHLKAQPDIIYHNGSVVTMEPVSNVAEAIAIKGELIERVGTDIDVLATAGQHTVIVDLNGAAVLPGFVDPHMHLFELAAINNQPLQDVQELVFSNGITSVGEAFVDEQILNDFEVFAASGNMQLNIDMYLIYNDNCNQVIGDWYLTHPSDLSSANKLRVAGVKIFTDGGTCGTIPALTFEYPGGGFGDLFLSDSELFDAMNQAHSNGYPLLIHAQGDSAVNQVLDAYDVLLTGTNNVLRHRIDHNSFIDPVNMGRYSNRNLVPVNFGAFPTCAEVHSNAISNAFGAEHISWIENWRLMHDANPGLKIAWKSDAPNLVLDPIIHLYSMVTKREVDSDGISICNPPAWLADHAITVEEALNMMTINAAYALHRDKDVGSLVAGKHADLVFLSDNPLSINPNDLHSLSILATMSKGKNVYCAPGSEYLCVSDLVTSSGQDFIEALIVLNPIDEIGMIDFKLKEAMDITFTILDVNGSLVMQDNLALQKGQNHYSFIASNFNSGIYFLRFEEGKNVITKQIVVLH